jgi:hypothetical protein
LDRIARSSVSELDFFTATTKEPENIIAARRILYNAKKQVEHVFGVTSEIRNGDSNSAISILGSHSGGLGAERP